MSGPNVEERLVSAAALWAGGHSSFVLNRTKLYALLIEITGLFLCRIIWGKSFKDILCIHCDSGRWHERQSTWMSIDISSPPENSHGKV